MFIESLNFEELAKKKFLKIYLPILLAFIGPALATLTTDFPYYDALVTSLIIYFTIFLCVATIIIVNQHITITNYKKDTIPRLRENYSKNTNKIFKEYLDGTFREVGSSISRSVEIHEDYFSELFPLVMQEEENQKEVEAIKKEYKKKFIKSAKKGFGAVCNNICHIAQIHLQTSGIGEFQISSCIKQLKPFYINRHEDIDNDFGYETDKSNLYARAVYRDFNSYNKDREIGKEYKITENEIFNKCINNTHPKRSIYCRDNLDVAYKNNNFSTESSNFQEHYTSTSCVPIYINKDEIGTIYYGFLSIDCLPDSDEKVFERENCKEILQPFARLLSTVYNAIDKKFGKYV